MAANTPQVSYQDIIRDEYKKCMESPVYFMRHYIKIQHPVRGTILFDLYPFQEDTLQAFHDYQFNIILKSRQMGISTLVAAYCLWLMIFNKDKNILIISLRQDEAKELVAKVRFAHDKLPTWLRVKCIEDNRLSLKFLNGSQIKATSTTKKSGVSLALSLLIIDEAALIEEAEDLWASAQPTLSTGGNSIVLSCVTKDTMVLTPQGIQTVGDFINTSKIGGYAVDEYKVMGVGKMRRGKLFCNNGRQKTNIIRTKFSELECTGNHKIWAYKNGKFGWHHSSELSVGDYVSLQYGMDMWGNDNDIVGFAPSRSLKIHHSFNPLVLTSELCYLLGLYIAEGSTYKVINKNGKMIGGSLTISCGDNISWVFDKLGMTYNCWDGLHYTVSNKNLIEFMEYLGFDLSVKATQKYIPARLLKMGKENVRWLLRGIFDGDGCGTNKIVKLTSTSKVLIQQVRFILTNFGIMGSIYLEETAVLNSRNHKIKHNNDVYNLEICGRNALRYYNSVGFNLNRKQKHIAEFKIKNLDRSCSRDVIPDSLELVKLLVQSSEMTYYEINKKYGIIVNSYCNSKTEYKTPDISRDNVFLLYSLFQDKLSIEQKDYWDKVIHENIMWCKITSIVPSENDTFDFSLPEDEIDFWCHSVIYNGVIGHQTPRGVGNWFHQMWVGAEENNDGRVGKNGFHPIRLMWQLHPERDEEWRRIEGEKIGNPKKASQEYDCNFLASGDNVVDLVIIEFYKKTYMKDPYDVRGADKGLWVWEYPADNHIYLVAADVARGDGMDFSAAQVLDITAPLVTQAAEYKGSFGTRDFANFLYGLASEYNSALLVVERESIGWSTLTEIIRREYKNLFYSSSDLKYLDVQRQITNKIDADEKKLVPGFSTNIKTRPLVISNLDLYFREKGIIISSKRTLGELETFIWKNGKAQAMSEKYNDDLVMSLGIGLWVRDTALRLRQQGIDLTRAALGQFNMTKSDDKTPIYRQKEVLAGRNSWKMNTGRQGFGNQNSEDISWLLG